MHGDDEMEQAGRKAGRRNRRQDAADAKASEARMPSERLGSRSIRIVKAGRPNEPNPRGRRPEATRYDAMPIAGHQRLPGYETPPRQEPSPRDDGIRSPDPTEASESARRRRSERDDEA